MHAEFLVDETPYCVWVADLDDENRRFLTGMNPDYFHYVGHVHASNLKRSERKTDHLAAIALRTTYSHGLETLFAVLSACIQAPHCPFAWLQKYRLDELKSAVAKIIAGKGLRGILPVEHVTFQELAKTVFVGLHGRPEYDRFVANFARLWRQLASDFIDDRIQDEYNSVKHGFRASSGGFQLQMGEQEAWGIPCPPEKMQTVGGTKFGSSYLRVKPLGATKEERRLNFGVSTTSLAWLPEVLEQRLRLIAASIHNVVTYLRHSNGIADESVMYMAPAEELFATAFGAVPSIDRLEVDLLGSGAQIKPRTKQDVLDFYATWAAKRNQKPR